MADVRPIPALRYSESVVPDLATVVTPPYDVIPEDQLAGYRDRSPNSFIRLIRPGTDYAGAAELLAEWTERGVLVEDPAAIYVHEVDFDGRRRRDLVAGLRLQDYADRVVLPHELTHRGPKEDRLALMRATGAAMEPLWFAYEGAGTPLPALVDEAVADASSVEFKFAGATHRLWVGTDPEWQRRVATAFDALPVLIADGHHRYETTLLHSTEVGGSEDAASRFTPAVLTDIDDPGLEVLPTHRLLKAGVKVVGGDPVASLEEALRAIEGRCAAAHYADGVFQVLTLEGEVAVVELHQQVIDNVLGRRSAEEMIEYTRDPAEAVRWVDGGRGVAAFLLGAPDLHGVLKLAREGKTMPQKSTYFNPKPPSGMLLHRLDPDRILPRA